jgi:predicted O-methyltransferase YrrM
MTEFDPLVDPAATVAHYPHLRHAPATARNRAPIAAALAELLPATPCSVLEIASGTGEHALWMARSLPQVTWQPSEATREGLAAIEVNQTEFIGDSLVPILRRE